MTKQGNIVFLIKDTYAKKPEDEDNVYYSYETISYIVADVGECYYYLIRISPDGDDYSQRIIVRIEDLKDNCFREFDFDSKEDFRFLEERNNTKNEKKIKKYVKNYEQESGRKFYKPDEN